MLPTIKSSTNVLIQCPRIIKIPISMIFLVMNFLNELCIIFWIIPEHYWQWCLIDCHISFTLNLKTEKKRKAPEAFICNDKSSFRLTPTIRKKKRISWKYRSNSNGCFPDAKVSTLISAWHPRKPPVFNYTYSSMSITLYSLLTFRTCRYKTIIIICQMLQRHLLKYLF